MFRVLFLFFLKKSCCRTISNKKRKLDRIWKSRKSLRNPVGNCETATASSFLGRYRVERVLLPRMTYGNSSCIWRIVIRDEHHERAPN